MEVRADPIDSALARAAECKQRLRLVLAELGTLRGSLPVEWSDLEAHFDEREAQVRCRASELEVKEQEFEARSRLVLDSVGKRERSVAEREQECPASGGLEQQQQQQQQQQDEEALDEDDEDDEMEDVKKGTTVAAAAAAAATRSVAAAAMETDSSSKKEHPAAGLAKAEVRVRPHLKSLCESMDADGLRRYSVEHRKDFGALRNEMPSALKAAVDPARLVLEAVQGYYPLEPSKEVQAPASKRACILLLEALASVLGGTATAGLEYHALVSPELRSLAKDLAEQWRSKLDVQSAPDGSSLDAQAFLQLLATFNLGSEYDEEELCSLVLAVARRKQTPALCRVLNLSHKIPEIVERLTNDAKQIEALQFAYAFDIMDQLQPVQLLKAYLKDARKSPTKTTGENTNTNNHQPQMDSLSKELGALKSVLKCIDDYNLELEYPPSPLQKRVALLEKMKSERKRTGGSVKGQAKRPRNGGYDRMNYYANNRGSSDKQQQHQHQQQQHQHQQQQQQQQVFAGVPYSFVPQGFERYSTYGAPAATALYSVDGATVYGSGVYGTQSASFSSYHQLAPLPPPPPGYQPAFLG